MAFVVKPEDLELPPTDLFDEIQRTVMGAWHLQDAGDTAAMLVDCGFGHLLTEYEWYLLGLREGQESATKPQLA